MGLAEAKISLYAELLRKKDPTDSEINIMYLLCKEPEIQDKLQASFDKERNNRENS